MSELTLRVGNTTVMPSPCGVKLEAELVMIPNSRPIGPNSSISLAKGTKVIPNKEIKEYW